MKLSINKTIFTLQIWKQTQKHTKEETPLDTSLTSLSHLFTNTHTHSLAAPRLLGVQCVPERKPNVACAAECGTKIISERGGRSGVNEGDITQANLGTLTLPNSSTASRCLLIGAICWFPVVLPVELLCPERQITQIHLSPRGHPA